MTLAAFRDGPAPPEGAPALRALWHAARGEWETAHGIVQAYEGRPDCDWVHAHLHRIEGDAGNAAYWYRRAGRPACREPIAQECAAMIDALSGGGRR